MRPYTNAHPDAIGNGSLRAIVSEHMKGTATTDTEEYILGLSYTPEIPPAGTPATQPYAATVTLTGSASANTATLVLKVKNKNASGTANSDVSFTITVAAAKVAWSSGAASAYSLKDVIDLINEDDAGGTNGKMLRGFRAWALDAPYDLAVNAASCMVTAAETYIMGPGNSKAYTKCWSRDRDVHTVDSDLIFYKRIGYPESRDRGPFEFIDIFGTITGTTDTGSIGGVRIYKDDPDDYVSPSGTYLTDLANHELYYRVLAANLSTARGSTAGVPAGKNAVPEVWRGPVIVEVRTDNVSVVDLNVLTRAVSF